MSGDAEDHVTPANLRLAVALKEAVETFMREYDVDQLTMRSMLMGILAGGAHHRAEPVETFMQDAASMYAEVAVVKEKLGRH